MTTVPLPGSRTIRRPKQGPLLGGLVVLVGVLCIASAGIGAYAIPPQAVVGALSEGLGLESAWAPDSRTAGVLCGDGGCSVVQHPSQ